ncbi:hypothetical protein [Marivirga arenosa]|uniref:Lipoprotein n=1 Tax=Marivirga arenosa TaxID=3059076 RepID=A0AA49JHI0_9BACT|nr:hypothetical protein [Marivirga sp. BKB1-2]WKK80580.2 hypothetical protein QYS47_26230 [Marivirga sp. BKB1-2]
MHRGILFIGLLIFGISCSEPDDKGLVKIYDSLVNQKQFYYQVEYSQYKIQDQYAEKLFGIVDLNRNSYSGISNAYFGKSESEINNFLQTIYTGKNWLYNLSSFQFKYSDSDILTDSLHSPLLINPEVLFNIKDNSSNISFQELNNDLQKWVFELKNKPDHLILIWSKKDKKLTELEYVYNVNSKDSYSRKWVFDYLTPKLYKSLQNDHEALLKNSQESFL